MKTTEIKITRTAGKLTEMFTENTGKHMLDSGGAYGRNWERNQGVTAESFSAAPSATWERNGWVTLDAWHFLNDRLEFTKTAEVLTRLMHVWELNDYENRNLYSLADQETCLEQIGATVGNSWNTYNWDNLLSQTLQGMDFELMGQSFTLLQVHGGCDVRGGYTLPVVFEVSSEYWLYDCDAVNLYCGECHLSGDTRGFEWYRHGDLPPTLFGEADRELTPPSGYDQANGCPDCGGDLEAEAMEACY